MKIIIQIPCLNEEENLPKVIKELPRKYNEHDIDILVINDGSIDNTSKAAKEAGVKYILEFKKNQGLGNAFQAGLDFCKKNNVDILINTDADNQYQSSFITHMIDELINNDLDIVLGCRKIEEIKSFSNFKKFLQRFGSFCVKILSGFNIPDATTGFRAYSKKAIETIYVRSKFSYTIDVIMQSYEHNFKIGYILVNTNDPTRESRLFKGNLSFITNQMQIILKSFLIYKPLHFFSSISMIFLIPGLVLIFRFLIFNLILNQGEFTQSIIFGSLLIIISLLMISIGLIGYQNNQNKRYLMKYIGDKFKKK